MLPDGSKVSLCLDARGTVDLDSLDPKAIALEDRNEDPPLRIGRDPLARHRSDSALPLRPDLVSHYHLVLPPSPSSCPVTTTPNSASCECRCKTFALRAGYPPPPIPFYSIPILTLRLLENNWFCYLPGIRNSAVFCGKKSFIISYLHGNSVQISVPIKLCLTSLFCFQSTWFLLLPKTFAKFYTTGSLMLIGR